MTLEHVRRLVAVWAHRTLVLGARDEVAYVYAFENRGEQIGVTLNHPHGQIYAYPTIPPILERETANANSHRERTGGCLWCDLDRKDLADGRRIVARGGGWLAAVPFFHGGRARSASRASATSGGSTSWSVARSTAWRECC